MHNREPAAEREKQTERAPNAFVGELTQQQQQQLRIRLHTKSKRRRSSSRGNSSASGLDLCLAKKRSNWEFEFVFSQFEIWIRGAQSCERRSKKKPQRADETEDERATRCVVFRAFISTRQQRNVQQFLIDNNNNNKKE